MNDRCGSNPAQSEGTKNPNAVQARAVLRGVQERGIQGDFRHGALELGHAAIDGLLVEQLELLPRAGQAGADDGIQ